MVVFSAMDDRSSDAAPLSAGDAAENGFVVSRLEHWTKNNTVLDMTTTSPKLRAVLALVADDGVADRVWAVSNGGSNTNDFLR